MGIDLKNIVNVFKLLQDDILVNVYLTHNYIILH